MESMKTAYTWEWWWVVTNSKAMSRPSVFIILHVSKRCSPMCWVNKWCENRRVATVKPGSGIQCLRYLELKRFYRPQTKFAKVMFLQVSVCPRGVCLSACWDSRPPGADTPQHTQCMLGDTANKRVVCILLVCICRGSRVPAASPAQLPGDSHQARQGVATNIMPPTTQFSTLQMAAPGAAISTPPSNGGQHLRRCHACAPCPNFL